MVLPEPVIQRGIAIAGENPMIVLYRPGSDDIVLLVSVWRATYSPAGAGRALTRLTGYETSAIACPCAAAEVRVNGVPARGEVHQPEGWFGSSAALAFAETWREI